MISNKGSRRFSRLAILAGGLFVFTLAFAVFGWGLHSKLSLYHVPTRPPSASVAKLLSERERPSDQAQAFSSNDFDIGSVLHSVVAISLEPIRITPEKCWDYEPLLPSWAPAFDGPSLRRPPPPHNA
jgi:hypothetical protein